MSELMSWSEQYALGVPEMDTTHQEFIAMVNRLHAMTNSAEFKQGFAELIAHTKAHFAREDVLMSESKFPALGEHQWEHNRVLGELNQFQIRVNKGFVAFGRAYIQDKLPEWFAVHANTMDRALAVHLQKLGASTH